MNPLRIAPDRRWLWLLGTALASMSCGRTPPLPATCALIVSPASLDFGAVPPGSQVVKIVSVQNQGSLVCQISQLALEPGSDSGFFLPPQSVSFSIGPDASATVAVGFAPKSVSLPLSRSGTLAFQTNDATQAKVEIPLTAQIKSNCVVTVAPAAVDFGHVMLGSSATQSVTVTDTGTGPCELSGVAIGMGSDSEFALGSGQVTSLTLAPGQSQQIFVSFDATDAAPPHQRTGTLAFQSTDENQLNVSVPLHANIDVGCDLTISPAALSFGNVILNATVTASITLGNDGSADCQVSGVALGAGTDSGFSLAAGQPTAFTVAVGASVAIPISFGAFNDLAPFLKTGTLIFKTGNSRAPDGSVPLSAYINTACVEASQWIYTVDQDGMFSRFDPLTLSFTDIGTLACPHSSSSPNSMAVDQSAVAWVAYSSGQLFQVDTGTAACQDTSWVVDQDGLEDFGMGFVFDPSTGLDTLYIAGGPDDNITQTSTLATVAFPSLVATPIGQVSGGLPELSGTGDGTLWGFIPDFASSTNLTSLIQIDPKSGATLQTFGYPALSTAGGLGNNWAMKFWGGSFWLFLGQSIYRVDRNAPQTVTTAIANTGRTIVGAGVSTCAPLH